MISGGGGSAAITNPITLGAAGHQSEVGSGAWFGDVAYIHAADANAQLGFDVVANNGHDAWIDILGNDIVAAGSAANYESLKLYKFAGGRMTIGCGFQGTGVSRPLILQAAGGTVGIGLSKTTVNASAYLDIDITGLGGGALGFLGPRCTTAQKNAIGSPAEGLEVYDTTLHKKCVFTGAAWETITSA